MIWAACAMAFIGFLRSSEFTVPSQSAKKGTIAFTRHILWPVHPSDNVIP